MIVLDKMFFLRSRNLLLFCFILVFFSLPRICFADVYKCTDLKGGVAYKATPCSIDQEGAKISINSRVEATHNNVVNDEETLPESPIDMPEICDSNIFGNWKAVWWQNGLEGERTTFALGDMRWRFSRDNIYTPYSEGFSSKSKFSCRGSKIFIYNIESGKEISNIRVHSLSYGELIVNEIGRYVHWKRI